MTRRSRLWYEDRDDLEGAIQVSGVYGVRAGKVTVRMALRRNGVDLGKTTATGRSGRDGLAGLVDNLVDKILEIEEGTQKE